jgi:hypothetical protein
MKDGRRESKVIGGNCRCNVEHKYRNMVARNTSLTFVMFPLCVEIRMVLRNNNC